MQSIYEYYFPIESNYYIDSLTVNALKPLLLTSKIINEKDYKKWEWETINEILQHCIVNKEIFNVNRTSNHRKFLNQKSLRN